MAPIICAIQLICGIGRNSTDKLIQTEHQAQLQLPNFVFGYLQRSVQTRTKGNQPENPRRPSLLLISSRAARATQTLDIDVDG